MTYDAGPSPDLRDQGIADVVHLRLPDDHVVAAARDQPEARRLLEVEPAVGVAGHYEQRHLAALDLVPERRGLDAREVRDASTAELQALARQVGEADIESQPLPEPLLGVLGRDAVDVGRQLIPGKALMLIHGGFGKRDQ